MSTATESKFQWNPTLFVAIGPTGRAMLCDCVQQIREHWSKAPEFLPKKSLPERDEEPVPAFFGFMVFLDGQQNETATDLPLYNEPLVKVIKGSTSSSDIAWQHLRPELQRIASIGVNTHYHRYKGFENEYHFVDLIVVAALEELKDAAILLDPPLGFAEQFTMNRRLGIFLLNQFEHRPWQEFKQRREAIGEIVVDIEAGMRKSPRPYTGCLFLDESDTSGLKFYRRIDAVKVVASFLFSLTATPLATPLKQLLARPNATESFFSFGLVKRRYDNQEVVTMLAGRLFADFTKILLDETLGEDHAPAVEDIVEKIQTQLNTEGNPLDQQRVKQHFAEIDDLIRQLTNNFGRHTSENIPFLLNVLRPIRAFLLQNITKWQRHLEDLKKRIRILEEKLRHIPRYIETEATVMPGKIWPLVVWVIIGIAGAVALYLFLAPLLYWGIAGAVWLALLYPAIKMLKKAGFEPGESRDNLEYLAMEAEIERLKIELNATTAIYSQFGQRIHRIEFILAQILLTREALQAKTASLRAHEEESWFVHNILWTGELDELFRRAIQAPKEKLIEFFANRSNFFDAINDKTYDFVGDLFSFCQQQFQSYAKLKFEEVLELVSAGGTALPIQTFLDALHRSSNPLWRFDLNKIQDRRVFLGYGEFWSSALAETARQSLDSIEALKIPGSRDVIMMQLAQGIKLIKFHSQILNSKKAPTNAHSTESGSGNSSENLVVA